jgi:inosine-uridine nucleoside N-ribohydrolase
MIPARVNKPIPVILDTDIGADIDDTWALAMMLKCPELDVKLVVADSGDTIYRAKLIARMLEVAGRTDVTVGVGLPLRENPKRRRQAMWIAGYELASYPGKVDRDGVGAIIQTIMASPRPVTLIGIGPAPNLGAALDRQPAIARNARFVGMYGSVRKGYNNSDTPCAECNVKGYTSELQKVFAAPWDITIAPLDSCGVVQLKGDKYATVAAAAESDPVIAALLENYGYWAQTYLGRETPAKSSILFDCVAIYLAFDDALLRMEDLPIRITDDGMTVIDPRARTVHVGTGWKDYEGFEDLLVDRLLSPTISPRR